MTNYSLGTNEGDDGEEGRGSEEKEVDSKIQYSSLRPEFKKEIKRERRRGHRGGGRGEGRGEEGERERGDIPQ